MKQNKFLLILLLVVLLLSFSSSFILAAERGLEAEYPKLDEEEITPKTTLPEYVKYIFKFSLIIAAVAAFAVLIYGGFRYLTSAGAPEAMREAKSWMFGGILGLVLLLCSYLILTTINPELISPKEPEIKPFVGIYLISDEGKKLYYIQDSPEIPKDFTPEKIVFISDKPADPDKRVADPDKLELDSIFIYPKKNWEGTPTKITNDGAWTTSSDAVISSLKSFKFLWHRPGIYLYKEEAGWETDSWPLFLQSSQEDLKDFSDKNLKSLKIVNEKNSINLYNVVLFEHILFNEAGWGPAWDPAWALNPTGKCSWGASLNMDSFDDKVRDKVSSIAIFKTGKLYGEIVFNEAIDCEGNYCAWKPDPEATVASYEISLSDTAPGVCSQAPHREGPGVEEWRSVSIHGNMAVLINTQEDLNGRCQLFHKLGCNELKESKVYSPLPRGAWGFYEPKRASIYPTMK
ncbi:hypothetical protein KJA17_00905 [Patescibacteria group bacterium]|nr:hypothetical protein [Patescibacteria group bacterium]